MLASSIISGLVCLLMMTMKMMYVTGLSVDDYDEDDVR